MASGRIKGITIEIDGDTTKLTTSLKQVYKQIRDTASTVFGGIKDFISNTWETIKTMAGTVWEAIKGGLSSAWKGIKTTAGMTFNTIKTKTNEGEIPQFYVKEYHPAIIDPETFDLLQAEVVRRSRTGKRYSAVSVFSSKVVCGGNVELTGTKKRIHFTTDSETYPFWNVCFRQNLSFFDTKQPTQKSTKTQCI